MPNTSASLFNEVDLSELFSTNSAPISTSEINCANPKVSEPRKLPKLSDLSDHELQEIIEENFVDIPPHESPLGLPSGVYLRWSVSPPDRVHATSPSKLGTPHRGPRGGTFSFSVQLVTCSENVFVPYTATEDMTLVARIYGKSKYEKKLDRACDPDRDGSNSFVFLEKNPIGNPLLMFDSSAEPVVSVVIAKGESIASFNNVVLTCGSNPARSASAPAAAKVWDWDYFLKIDVVRPSGSVIRSLFSEHITTDSNRSQTREKRKRPAEFPTLFPSCKRPANYPIAPNFGIFQPRSIKGVQPFAGSFGLAFPAFPSTSLKL